MLIVFDVDGTLVGGERHDWACFDQAIEAVLSFKPTPEFFASLPEITAQAMAAEAVARVGREKGKGLEENIRDEYLRRLRLVHLNDPLAFPARNGVVGLLARLSKLNGVGVAIATGDWRSTSSFKLGAAGIDTSTMPMATSSDAPSRSEIIQLAARRAKRPLSDVVYIGDGVWDLKACKALGVPFIGTGARLELLKNAGAEHMLEILEEALFLSKVLSVTGFKLAPV